MSTKPQEILQYHCPVIVGDSRIVWGAAKDLVVYNIASKSFEAAHGVGHSDTIRSLAYSRNGSKIASGGDDKRVIIWALDKVDGCWKIERNFLHGKKIMAVNIDENDLVVFGDKFGDFYRMNESTTVAAISDFSATDAKDQENEEDDDEFTSNEIHLIYGHIAAVTTSLYSKKRKLFLSADRDEKIRIAKYPRADVIVSFLMHHKRYVSHMVWGNSDETILVSAGADGKILVWDLSNPENPRLVRKTIINTAGGFHTVMANTTNGDVYYVSTEKPQEVSLVPGTGEEMKNFKFDFEIQSLIFESNRLVAIDSNSHLHYLGDDGRVLDSVRLANNVPGVPISYLKMVHHENLKDGKDERETKRKRKGGLL